MATHTDLSGMLYNDDDNLRGRITSWLSRGDPKTNGAQAPELPAKVVGRWRTMGAASAEVLFDISLSTLPKSAHNLVSDIEKRITEKLGVNPAGTLRVRAWGKGASAAPGIDMQRTLIPGEAAYASPGEALLRGELAENRIMVREMFGLMVTITNGQMVLIGKQSEEMAKLSTLRGSTMAVGDNSSMGALFGLGVLIFAAPFMRSILDGSGENSGDVAALAGRFRLMMDAWIQGGLNAQNAQALQNGSDRPAPPPGAAAPETPQITEDVDAEIVEDGDFTIEQVLSRLNTDEAFANDLAKGALSNPALLKAAGIDPALAQMVMGRKS